jgi:predicted O-methyltransferase YrrM
MRDVWGVVKRFGARKIENVELGQLGPVADTVVETYLDDPNRGVIAALCRALEAKTFFEIGTNRGRTAWTVARNNPDCEVFTLDLPSRASIDQLMLQVNASDRDFFVQAWDRGDAYRGREEEQRITTLEGDSATFDFSPYTGRMDVVFIDGAHSYSYVKNDSERAFRMLAPDGLIAWDDYPAIPGVYRYLNELALGLDRRLYHIFGTRLVLYSQRQLVSSLGPGGWARQYAA